MASTIEIGDLIRALGRAKATFVAQVTAGSTTTTINLAGLNLGTANLAGDLVLLDAGALGTGSAPTLAEISGNTAATLTVPALSAAPAVGYSLWIFVASTVQTADLSVQSITIPAGDTWEISSGQDVSFYTLTNNGTLRVDGILRVQGLIQGSGSVLIQGPGGQIITGAFTGA